MREILIRMVMARPFAAIVILLDGGYPIDVLSPEFIILERAVEFATVVGPAGHRYEIEVERIVAMRTLHPVDD